MRAADHGDSYPQPRTRAYTMTLSRILRAVGLFGSNLSAAEYVARAINLLLVTFGLGGGFWTASLSPGLRQYGPIIWLAIGLATALVVVLILYFIKVIETKARYNDYLFALAQKSTRINPMRDHFEREIIPIEELRLPGKALHTRKHFKHCSFVGPGALAIQGGTYVNNGFYEYGTVVALPEDTVLTGVVVLDHCTVENCELYRITILADQGTAREIRNSGANVVGLPD